MENTSSEITIDKCKLVFYNYHQWYNKRPIQNYANGVGAPLIRTGLHIENNAELRLCIFKHNL